MLLSLYKHFRVSDPPPSEEKKTLLFMSRLSKKVSVHTNLQIKKRHNGNVYKLYCDQLSVHLSVCITSVSIAQWKWCQDGMLLLSSYLYPGKVIVDHDNPSNLKKTTKN
ncbi:hypothetical protein FQA47_002796 [Oryzias melastigma]|uniref:Uncharacterized protein n=1 Tax=Oryzias melastigma TaxID=30732 RepID=A0A834C303_ORYME|nr:hypothetical protein FQA47_002796 [Oryzias melastigma]